ncbi:uncharacterized protein N7473_008795 [Penicillium subrubescens]|jgi:hypothetical protein|uniref:Uncharacterized protein n=1 Tax=Penicillium subrubescens TaxID=1316194 RepID=A0A1Q5UCM8_9EURO|nr:uncharacterized protein N7473_008795 [Penicillium subrubescens]KAJ5886121.1 hypothetical protein N7473_008795 [Penicillium subrubescens]OKP10224.1 hypothetical protein PENSUB_4398 [Penicillium subrubescens]
MFNQMLIRMAGVSTERAEAPRVPARNLVLDCRQWLRCIETLGRDSVLLWDAGIYPGEPWVNCNFFSESRADAEVFGFGITARVA